MTADGIVKSPGKGFFFNGVVKWRKGGMLSKAVSLAAIGKALPFSAFYDTLKGPAYVSACRHTVFYTGKKRVILLLSACKIPGKHLIFRQENGIA